MTTINDIIRDILIDHRLDLVDPEPLVEALSQAVKQELATRFHEMMDRILQD